MMEMTPALLNAYACQLPKLYARSQLRALDVLRAADAADPAHLKVYRDRLLQIASDGAPAAAERLNLAHEGTAREVVDFLNQF